MKEGSKNNYNSGIFDASSLTERTADDQQNVLISIYKKQNSLNHFLNKSLESLESFIKEPNGGR